MRRTARALEGMRNREKNEKGRARGRQRGREREARGNSRKVIPGGEKKEKKKTKR